MGVTVVFLDHQAAGAVVDEEGARTDTMEKEKRWLLLRRLHGGTLPTDGESDELQQADFGLRTSDRAQRRSR